MPVPVKKKRIVVLGSRSVGKSSLVEKFVNDSFKDNYHPTIEAVYTTPVNYNGVEYECDIVDTAGQDEFTIFNTAHAIGMHGYILVYSVTTLKSYEMITIIHDKILNCWGVDKIPGVIVASKCDLDLSQRQVKSSDGKDLADRLGCAFIETSAKTDLNVGKVFELCLGEIVKHTTPNQTESEKPMISCTVQ